MGLIRFDAADAENQVAQYSAGRGQVLRSKLSELTRIAFDAGAGAEMHSHPEEQILYVLEGSFDVIVGDETYVVEAGEASFHPSDVPHRAVAREPSVGLSFKCLVAPNYDKTGDLA